MRMYANDANKRKLIHPELSYKLTGILFRVHNQLGRYCREKQYQDAIEIELKKEGLNYEREKILLLAEHNSNKVDFFINGKIILDCKAKSFITKEDYYQIIRYLKFAKVKLGIIANFRNKQLRPKRVLNSEINL